MCNISFYDYDTDRLIYNVYNTSVNTIHKMNNNTNNLWLTDYLILDSFDPRNCKYILIYIFKINTYNL